MHEEQPTKEFARKLGFKFVPQWATELSIERVLKGEYTPYTFLPTPQKLKFVSGLPFEPCVQRFNNILVFPNGDIASCSISANRAVIGNVMTDTLEDIWIKRRTLAMCKPCVKKRAWEVVCPFRTLIDKECAKLSPEGDQWKYFVERRRKDLWERRMKFRLTKWSKDLMV